MFFTNLYLAEKLALFSSPLLLLLLMCLGHDEIYVLHASIQLLSLFCNFNQISLFRVYILIGCGKRNSLSPNSTLDVYPTVNEHNYNI